jgi:steroid 5-alpha reductase family enzyme
MDQFSHSAAWDALQPLLNDIARIPSTVVSLLKPHLGLNPLVDMFVFFILLSIVMWLLNVFTNNYSWVDRSWSIVPIFYMSYMTRYYSTTRLQLMIILCTLWGMRLTGNFIRKGGYNPWSEAFHDYRWPVLRKSMPEPMFQLFNLFFVAIYQNVILFLIAVPTAYFAHLSTKPLFWLDAVAATLLLTLLFTEFTADNQMWAFQGNKRKLIKQGKYNGCGFITTGLYRYSRHPNYFAENSIWWCFYLFSIASSGEIINWCIIGPILLTLLFQGSAQFSESISAAKYPLYKTYQKTTSKMLPLWPGPKINEKTE